MTPPHAAATGHWPDVRRVVLCGAGGEHGEALPAAGRAVLGWALSLDRQRLSYSSLGGMVLERAYLPVRASGRLSEPPDC